MAPQKKNVSNSGIIYEPNYFVPFTKVQHGAPSEFYPMIKILASSKLAYFLHEAPTIQCELVEEFWSSNEYLEKINKISFVCKGKPYTLTPELLGYALRLPENNSSSLASNDEIRKMLDETNYALTPSNVNLGEIVRKEL